MKIAVGGQVLFLAAIVARAALSQQVVQAPGELSPDRPGFGDSTEVVGKLAFEVEGGFERDMASHGADREVSRAWPETLLRFGVSQRVELRFEGDGHIFQTVTATANSSRVSGFSDHTIGMKVKLRSEQRHWPTLSLIGSLSIPIGSAEFTTGAVDPEVKLIWSKTLPASFSISGTVNVASVSDNEGRVVSRAFSLSTGHGLGCGFAGFWEVYHMDLERGQGASWAAASGLTHLLGKNTQLDLSAGHTMTGVRSGWFLATGFAFRRPHSKLSR